MLSKLNKQSTILALHLRGFGTSERQKERRYRVHAPHMKIKNFTKHPYFQKDLDEREAVFNARKP
jgi:hypothetical protein